MKFKVVYTSVPPIEIEKESLLKLGVEYIERPAPTEDEVLAIAQDADVLIDRSEPCTRRVISNLKSCRLIVTPKVGYDNIDVAAATEYGVCVANIPGLSVDEVSDHAMALLLACSRKLFQLDNMVRAGGWQVFHGKEMQAMWRGISLIRGQTLGLIGFGAISRAVVPKAKAFGLRVLVYDPYITPDVTEKTGAASAQLEQLLKESDYISIHTPLTPATRHMLGVAQFKLMKPTAFIINTSRGAVIDEGALYNALVNGYIAGAGLDVVEKEPVKMDNPLLKLDNVIVTGHSAHYSDQVWAEQRRRPAEEIIRIMSGQWPRGWVNPQVEAKFIERWRNTGASA
ncbi:MAG: C-terminal binding protein [Dehalococcoidales bacterium]|nr:C-terminal binding protein [Dehalococcoidales bacterium]